MGSSWLCYCSAQGHLACEAWTKGAAKRMTVGQIPSPQQRADSALLSAANEHSSLPPSVPCSLTPLYFFYVCYFVRDLQAETTD